MVRITSCRAEGHYPIGGTTTAARNIISGNFTDGVALNSGVSGVQVQGNYIGTDPTGFEVYEQELQPRPGKAADRAAKAMHTFKNDKTGSATYALYENFLECVRSRNRETLCTPELGAAAFTTVNMGVLSYRHGKVLFWDSENRKTTDVDPGWARAWEKRSKERSKPSHIIGWEGGDKGSTLQPPAYQKLEGPWKNGQDPAETGVGG